MTLGERITAHAKERAENAGAGNVTTHIRAGEIADKIFDVEEAEKARILVLDRRGLGRMNETLLGSISQKVLHHVDGTVVIVK